ncbi:MAG TPA: hypothetical protein VM577_08865 [Anaerovoracaceae bacterium]|nr:hypothetical protein [Anaerovoracaceae bacterium]
MKLMNGLPATRKRKSSRMMRIKKNLQVLPGMLMRKNLMRKELTAGNPAS